VSPSESIQAAINNATAGDIILVSAGIYNESLQINQSISLIGEDRDTTIINAQNSTFIVNIEANNVTIQGFTLECSLNLVPSSGIGMFSTVDGCTISNDIIENSQQGITLESSNNNTISDNIITNNQEGIAFSSSASNIVSDNVITANSQGGISLVSSNQNLFSGNVISNNNYQGIFMYISAGNVFSGNTIVNNYPLGETISYCYYNIFYDNNFYQGFQVSNSNSTFEYGGQGNYWSNYTGHNRGDGIGNTPYVIDNNNTDSAPLMGEFSSFTATFVDEPYQVSVVSNSTISAFEFEVGTETGNEIIEFNVTSVEGTAGFSRIVIPTGLMTTSATVLVDDREIAPKWLNIQNPTSNYLYLTYSSGSHVILIISSKTLDLYDQLLEQFLTLNATYYELLSNYTTQLNNYTTQLNNTDNTLLSAYASLLGNYNQLQQKYQDLNTSYQQHLSDENQNQQNVRSLMYIFAAGTAVLIVATVYFSKRMYSRPKTTSEKREAILSQPNNSAAYNLL
jgi:parallel beta-helix repeat protein